MTVDLQFETEFSKFLAKQQAGATGLRLEMLQRDLEGTKKLFKSMLWPILKSFDGFILEYEFVNAAGVKMFVDAYYEPLDIAFECEGFVVHAGNITREKFSRERARIRTLATNGYIYFPFSWDELDKKPEACRAAVYELFGKLGAVSGEVMLSLHEKELLRHAIMWNKPFRMKEVCDCLRVSHVYGRKVVRSLIAKNLLKTCEQGRSRNHHFIADRSEITRRRVI